MSLHVIWGGARCLRFVSTSVTQMPNLGLSCDSNRSNPHSDRSWTMAQHFLLSAQARTLSLKAIYQAGDDEAYAAFCKLRWPDSARGIR